MCPLQRYISKELTHFVGRGLAHKDEQYSLLVGILTSGWLTHPPHNPLVSGNLSVKTNARISVNEMYSPEVVCFCDIPLSDIEIHVRKYSRFGLSFDKQFLIRKGANPVFYVARNSMLSVLKDTSDIVAPEQAWERLDAEGMGGFFDMVPRWKRFDKMLPEYHDLLDIAAALISRSQSSPGVSGDYKRLFDLRGFLDFQVFAFLKFFDDARSDEDPENFYMEREWRMLGNLKFSLSDVRRVILPESYAASLRKDVPSYIGQVTFVD